MKENVPVAPAATTTNELPARVQEALGELVGAAKGRDDTRARS